MNQFLMSKKDSGKWQVVVLPALLGLGQCERSGLGDNAFTLDGKLPTPFLHQNRKLQAQCSKPR